MRPFTRIWIIMAMVAVATICSGLPKSDATGGGGIFGDGSDGAITFSASGQFTPPVDAIVQSGASGNSTFQVSNSSGLFQAGQKILIQQTRGAGGGGWEINEVQSFALSNVVTASPLANSYTSGGADAAQVLVVPQYTNMTVNAGVNLTAKPWDGSVGGILAFITSGTVTIDGTVTANGATGATATNGTANGATGGGFRGGSSIGGSFSQAQAGEGTGGSPALQTAANGNGGGGALSQSPGLPTSIVTGGGGGNGSGGQPGGQAQGTGIGGAGGSSAGTVDLTTMVFGGGAGGEANSSSSDAVRGGASGGGIIYITGTTIAMSGSGSLSADGGNGDVQGNPSGPRGSAGAGGSVLIRAQTLTLNSASITATGGQSFHAAGGSGRIRVEYCTGISGGIADPPASIAQISCGSGDSDSDGCLDTAEQQTTVGSENSGGRRDPKNFWDFFDTPDESNVRDKSIAGTDFFRLLARFGSTHGLPYPKQDALADALSPPPPAPAYHAAFDRGPSSGPNSWNLTRPDGAVAGTDFFAILVQFGHSCA